MTIPRLSWTIEPTQTMDSLIYVARTTDGHITTQATSLSELGHRMDSALEGHAIICEQLGTKPFWEN